MPDECIARLQGDAALYVDGDACSNERLHDHYGLVNFPEGDIKYRQARFESE